MRDLYLIAFILLIPALAVLGHDIYMAYNNTELEVTERFWLSDLGWLWVNYSPDTYNWAVDNTDAAIWNSIVDPLLQESALYVSSAPFAAFLVIIIFLKIFGIGPFEGQGLMTFIQTAGIKKKKGDFSFSGGGSKKKAKYKRK